MQFVCVIHQNVVLLCDAIKGIYRVSMAFLVCDIKNKLCMVHRCAHCPRLDDLEKKLAAFYLKRMAMNKYISKSRKQLTTCR